MTAKEKQLEFIKTCLKPTIKQFGYQTSGQTWWKDKGGFFNVVNIQNYSWNSKDSVDFRFNIGVALKATIKDPQGKKATYNDLVTHLDEGTFLPNRKNRKYGDNQGYTITNNTELKDFCNTVKADFENYILPKLDYPQNLDDLIKFYEPFSFWHDNLKRVINDNNLRTV